MIVSTPQKVGFADVGNALKTSTVFRIGVSIWPPRNNPKSSLAVYGA
jgi:hypothetical protein